MQTYSLVILAESLLQPNTLLQGSWRRHGGWHLKTITTSVSSLGRIVLFFFETTHPSLCDRLSCRGENILRLCKTFTMLINKMYSDQPTASGTNKGRKYTQAGARLSVIVQ